MSWCSRSLWNLRQMLVVCAHKYICGHACRTKILIFLYSSNISVKPVKLSYSVRLTDKTFSATGCVGASNIKMGVWQESLVFFSENWQTPLAFWKHFNITLCNIWTKACVEGEKISINNVEWNPSCHGFDSKKEILEVLVIQYEIKKTMCTDFSTEESLSS